MWVKALLHALPFFLIYVERWWVVLGEPEELDGKRRGLCVM